MKIIIEGNIHSGKTTLINYLSNFFKNQFTVYDSGFSIFHPNEEFNIAILSKKDPKKWTFARQLNFIKLLHEIQNKKYDKNVIFNRSIYSAFLVFTNKEYMDMNLSSIEYEFLENVFKNCIKDTKEECDLLIYLYASEEVLQKRNTKNIFKNEISKFQKLYALLPFSNYFQDKNIIKIDTTQGLKESDYKMLTDIIQKLLDEKNTECNK